MSQLNSQPRMLSLFAIQRRAKSTKQPNLPKQGIFAYFRIFEVTYLDDYPCPVMDTNCRAQVLALRNPAGHSRVYTCIEKA